MDEKLKAALVTRARAVIKSYGIEFFMNYPFTSGPCGCLGPRHGEPLCNCEMNEALRQNRIAILSEIDALAAIQMLRINIIRALR